MAKIALRVAAIGANFIPVVGPFLSMGLNVAAGLLGSDGPHVPKLMDRQVMSSANGSPVLFGYGTDRVSGEVLWSSGLLVLRKGSSDFTSYKDLEGNSVPTNQTFVTNVAVAFGQGPADITRLWYNSKLVYDTRGTVYRGPWQAGVAYVVNDVVLDWSLSGDATPNTNTKPLVYFICVQDISAAENTDYPHETAVFWAEIAANYDRATGQVLYAFGFLNNSANDKSLDLNLSDPGLNTFNIDPSDYINPKIYRGDETQMPDPFLESQIGVGRTSAHRGICYMVLENFVVWDFDNRLPNIRAEITWSTEFSYPLTSVGATNGSKLEISPLGQIVHVLDATSSNMQRLDLSTSVISNPTALPATVLNDAFAVDEQGNVWVSHDTGSGFSNLYKLSGTDYSVLLTIAMPSGVFPEQIGFCTSGGLGYIACGSRLSGGTGQFHFEVYRADGLHIGGVSFGSPGTITYGEWFAYPVSDGTNIWMITPHTSDGNFDIWKITLPGLVATSHTVTPGTEGESLCCAWYGGENTLIMPTANGLIAKWDIASSTYSMLVTGTINPANLMWDNSDFASAYSAVHAQGGNRLWTGFFKIPYDASKHMIAAWSVSSLDPVAAVTNVVGSGQTFYTGVKLYDLDNWFGAGWAGLQYAIDGNQMWLYDGSGNSLIIVQPASVSVLALDRTTTGPGMLSNIATDVCRRVGVDADHIDVSQLTGMSIVGYTIARPSQARQILEPLAKGKFFDVVESDKKLKFLPRPQPISLTIPGDDLGLAKDKGAITEEIGQESDFPQQIDVSYKDPALNYQVGHQYHWRSTRVVNARDRQLLELPYATTAFDARQTAIKLMKQAWKAKLPHSFNLFRASYLQLDPADVVSFTDPFTGLGFTDRILTLSSGQDRSMKLSLVSDSPATYTTSGAVGAGPGTSTSGASDTGGTGSGSTGSNGGGSGGSGSGVVTGGTGFGTLPGVPYDIAFLLPGPIPGSYDWRFTVDDNLPTLPIDLTGSSLTAEVASSGTVSIPINQIPGGTAAPVQIGSLNFTAGQKVGTFTFANAVTLAQGDVLQIDPSSVTDATLAGVSGVFAATR